MEDRKARSKVSLNRTVLKKRQLPFVAKNLWNDIFINPEIPQMAIAVFYQKYSSEIYNV